MQEIGRRPQAGGTTGPGPISHSLLRYPLTSHHPPGSGPPATGPLSHGPHLPPASCLRDPPISHNISTLGPPLPQSLFQGLLSHIVCGTRPQLSKSPDLKFPPYSTQGAPPTRSLPLDPTIHGPCCSTPPDLCPLCPLLRASTGGVWSKTIFTEFL